MTNQRTIIITAGDSKVLPALKGLIQSIQSFPEHRNVELGCLDVGQTDAGRAWLQEQGFTLCVPDSHFNAPEGQFKPYMRAFAARPFLRDYFPGRDVYLWIDSDVWLQGWWVVDDYCKGALESGFAIAHERERGYRFQGWLFGWFAKHLIKAYGVLDAAWLLSRPHLNAGIFALHKDSPQWDVWRDLYQAAFDRTGSYSPHDQFSVNHMIYGGALSSPLAKATILPPRYNWIVDRGAPMWNDANEVFCEPYPPYRTIGALHLAGPGKTTRYKIRRTGGGEFEALLAQGIRPP